MQPIATMTLATYLDGLASGEAAPGGGAAVAITGAQAAALLAMVWQVTAGAKEAFAGDVAALNATREELLALATADGDAFLQVMAAYRLPKATPAEAQERTAAVQAALRGAAEVPLKVMRILAGLFEAADQTVAAAKPAVISDAAIAVLLLSAALKAAAYNVRINLKYIKDDTYTDKTEQDVKELLAGKKKHRRQLVTQIKGVLAGGR